MGKTTSAIRMQKLRMNQKSDPDYDIDAHREKERKRIATYRAEKQKKQTKEDLEEQRKKDRLRKRKQREKEKKEDIDGRLYSNQKRGRKESLERKKQQRKEIDNLTLKIKLFANENRCLKRKLKESEGKGFEVESSPKSVHETASPDSTLLSVISPSAKKRGVKRLSLTSTANQVKRKFRLDRVLNQQNGPNYLKEQIEQFIYKDENSIVTPDTKKAKKGIRYRLASLKDLHQRFLADENHVCSYSQFTRYIPENVVKPKPEDWGTCLCMPCLNPELKLEALKRQIPDINLSLQMVKDGTYLEEIEEACRKISNCNEDIKYIEWSKEKGSIVKATTYFSKKNAVISKSKDFAEKLRNDLQMLYDHSLRFRSQYERIYELKQFVKGESNDSIMIRIDWSENVDLYQTRQEKSQYYTSISASVNTAVLYDSKDVTSYVTISDVKSHMAEATWASLSKIFNHIDMSSTKHLFIVSDSPTSQYRNKKNTYLLKLWAVEQSIDVTWVFTESGHGKGPMDGVGGCVKKVIKDTLAYNPDGIIRNTAQLLQYLPKMSNIVLETYDQADVDYYKELYPGNFDLTSKGIGISKVHEIYCSKENDNKVKWKALSSNEEFQIAKINIVERNTSQSSKNDPKNNSNIDESDVETSSSDSSSDCLMSENENSEEDIEENEFSIVAKKSQESIGDKYVGKFYCVYYDEGMFWGRLMKVKPNGDDSNTLLAEFRFLHYTSCGIWEFPKKEDESEIDIKFVFLGPCTPLQTTKKGFCFEEEQYARKIYKNILHK